MRTKWSMILFLSAISVNVMASPVVSNDKPRSPFSIDRQSESNTVKNRADINNIIDSYSLILKENSLLSQEVKNWAQKQGYKLLWRSDKDYIIYKTVRFNGQSREDILKSLGDLFSSEQYGLVVKLYAGNNVLVIDSQ
ncbi:TPA: type 4b pilus CFA/III biogenesis protein CofC [Escherichia coli]|uniref:type 4b pilus CFA/III biogenesis protein CofC n=1 Tax=Escherichia coli TaxID=562 RepID=UPI0007A5DC17|nr:type 4b pilus CFA/III biogenesis protein CofC [Escherichia coli]EFL9258227.1 type 4b pilus CFA/III biogenesis protein CofC [Escherichia coli]EFO4237444.1 type 4b pilus CFA/III biogenesis protein CofC [Escherichia coli]EIA5927791.1 type 4b pilus CFA/III biogenesis protein CofC [Escherichia coli]EKD5687298.1 type 4b pilus CFA/III biogenesis protein CofC [Escherichia coli]ELA5715049.1 type 4b pilus CFA/III biogenesis protein CofC [Escherichia coli]